MVDREIGAALVELQNALIGRGMPEADAAALVDEIEARIAEALGGDDEP